MIFDVLSKTSTVGIEVDGIIIALFGIETISSWTKASNGHYVKKCGGNHSINKLECISATLPEV